MNTIKELTAKYKLPFYVKKMVNKGHKNTTLLVPKGTIIKIIELRLDEQECLVFRVNYLYKKQTKEFGTSLIDTESYEYCELAGILYE